MPTPVTATRAALIGTLCHGWATDRMVTRSSSSPVESADWWYRADEAAPELAAASSCMRRRKRGELAETDALICR